MKKQVLIKTCGILFVTAAILGTVMSVLAEDCEGPKKLTGEISSCQISNGASAGSGMNLGNICVCMEGGPEGGSHANVEAFNSHHNYHGSPAISDGETVCATRLSNYFYHRVFLMDSPILE